MTFADEWVMNEVYQELIQWNTEKLYTSFSMDGGGTIKLSTLVWQFVVDFICKTEKGRIWLHTSEWDNNKEDWIQMMRQIKQQAIARELK